MKETLCDVCMDPGHCCRLIALSGSSPDPTRRPQEPMSYEQAEHFALMSGHHHFRPAFQDSNGVWRWSCTALQSDGRCGIYENRPPVCRAYSPGQDPLCVHYSPAEQDSRQEPPVVSQSEHSTTED